MAKTHKSALDRLNKVTKKMQESLKEANKEDAQKVKAQPPKDPDAHKYNPHKYDIMMDD